MQNLRKGHQLAKLHCHAPAFSGWQIPQKNLLDQIAHSKSLAKFKSPSLISLFGAFESSVSDASSVDDTSHDLAGSHLNFDTCPICDILHNMS
jgi:hypothetical protein